MTEQPFAKYEDGALWLMQSGRYERTTRFNAFMWWATFRTRNDDESQKYTKQLRDALRAHDKAEREAA